MEQRLTQIMPSRYCLRGRAEQGCEHLHGVALLHLQYHGLQWGNTDERRLCETLARVVEVV